jgi:hypothetical protein
MRIASSSTKHHYSAAIGIFLIVAALMVGMTACDGDTYELTISSASGGSVNTPGEGVFTYDEGTVVPLVATPDDGYQFLSWTGDMAHIADPSATSTTITMNGDYAILANFETDGGGEPGGGRHL